MTTESLSTTRSRPIIVGPLLRAKLHIELRHLSAEWNTATAHRRKEIVKLATLICDLLNEEG